ncbi:MAG: hypothetical protein JW754_04430 [Candidatus Aenigmarchaeota archaeon]|nr:hypothetical protein [Candidatus Aenigmarchaeota archaeon]
MAKTPGGRKTGNYWLNDLEEGRDSALQKICPVYSNIGKCKGPVCELYDHCDQHASVEINEMNGEDIGDILHGMGYVKDATDF